MLLISTIKDLVWYSFQKRHTPSLQKANVPQQLDLVMAWMVKMKQFKTHAINSGSDSSFFYVIFF